MNYRNQLNNILDSQNKANSMQAQISSGKKLLNRSDDPILSMQINRTHAYMNQLESYQHNSDSSQVQIDHLETVSTSMINLLQRSSELVTLAFNGTLNNADRENVATELQATLDNLLGLANSQDHLGQYMFAGYNTDIVPYTFDNGSYTYQGDQGERTTTIGPNVEVELSRSGFHLFENVSNGNGIFITSDGPSVNAGTGVISSGSIDDKSAYVEDTYTITFVTNGGGDLAYQIIGATSGQVVPALPATIPANVPAYVDGEDIKFGGISVEITGTPAVGDDFQIEPSAKQNVFTSLQNIINNLQQDITNDTDRVAMINKLNSESAALNQGQQKLTNFLVDIGARANLIEHEKTLNDNLLQEQQIAASNLEDLDFTTAITKFNQELFTLQVAQQSFLQIQGLSLFNLI